MILTIYWGFKKNEVELVRLGSMILAHQWKGMGNSRGNSDYFIKVNLVSIEKHQSAELCESEFVFLTFQCPAF